MDQAKEARKMDAHDLYRTLEQFFNDNKDGYQVEYRWLAQQTIVLKNLAHHLWANGADSFRQKNQRAIADLRLAEIEAKRGEIARADEKLADEAKLIQRQRQSAA